MLLLWWAVLIQTVGQGADVQGAPAGGRRVRVPAGGRRVRARTCRGRLREMGRQGADVHGVSM